MNILGMVSSLLFTAAALAQSTAFTYQGKLQSGSAPSNGPHDFRFRLFDALSGGNQIGATQCIDNVLVSDGDFTVTLDFGQQFAATSPRFLDIQTRTEIGQPCSDDFRYVLLSPRQQCTASPQANCAKSAFGLSSPDGAPADAMIVDNNGRVGIGTALPQMALHIRQPGPVFLLQDTNDSSTQRGEVFFWNNVNTTFGSAGFQSATPVWSMVNLQNNGHICFFPGASGNVGIGTATPLSKLDVRGDIVIGAASHSVMRGEENLRVLRGTINTAGQVLRGSGFTSQRTAAGTYQINYAQAFSSVPAVTATAYRSPEAFVTSIRSSTTFQVTIVTFNGSISDADFDFIIVGGP